MFIFVTLSTQAISGLFSVDIGDVCTCFSDVVMAFGSKHCAIPSETHSMVSRTNIRDLPRKLSRADRVLLLTNRTDLCFVIFMICKEFNICKKKKKFLRKYALLLHSNKILIGIPLNFST